MAHGDYDCCAICDKKMSYSGDPSTKDDLCSSCAVDFESKTPADFIENLLKGSIKKSELKEVYSPCFYPNMFDLTIAKYLGVDFVEECSYGNGGLFVEDHIEKLGWS
jgi:hypothetical protein